MANNSRLTYVEPKDKFKKINMEVILKYEPIVVGIYCKLVTLSSGKSLSIDFLAKRLKVSKEKMRKTIVFLESEGYILRHPLRDENNRMSGWNYFLYAEPVEQEARTHAGFKKEKKKDSRVEDFPCYGISDNTEDTEDNINIDNAISINGIDNINDIDKKSPNGDKKTCVSQSLFNDEQTEERKFEEYMKEHYPYIMKMDKPLTRRDAAKLKSIYGEDIVIDAFEAMNNYKPLIKKYRDAYKVAINWCERRKNDAR